MFRLVLVSASSASGLQQRVWNAARALTVGSSRGARMMSSGKAEESDAEFNSRYEAYFNRPDIDGWEVRKAMGDLAGMDIIPEPTIVAAALRACRRLNDYALTTRILEVVKCKCGNKEAEIWPYLLQELKPTLDELGISTPEDLGYDKPELMLQNPYEM